MTSVVDRSEQGAIAQAPQRAGIGPLLLRLHFYAGVLVAPFLVVAAVTGLLYTVAPQLDAMAYGRVLHATPSGTALPIAEQVAVAQGAVPALEVVSVRVGEGTQTTRVVFADPSLTGDRERTVYVDPWAGQVRGSLETWFGSTPAVTWLDDLHRNLLLGDIGRHYSELAASWLWVVALGGLVLWLRRRRSRRRLRSLLMPELAMQGRRRVLSLHGTTGLACVLGLLFLSATGLTWSRYAGEHFSAALTALDATAPELATTLPGGVAASTDVATDSGRVITAARAAGLDGPVVLTLPTDGGAWTVAQDDDRWPVRLDEAAVDGQTGEIIGRNAWSDRPLLSKTSSLGISAHMGVLFGPWSQLFLALTALGLLAVVLWGYRSWWQRRPTRNERRAVGSAPPRAAWRELRPDVLAAIVTVTAAVSWAVPLLGASLIGFLVLDAALHAVRRQAVAAAAVPGRDATPGT